MEPENKKPLSDSELRRVAGGAVDDPITIRLPGPIPEEKWKCTDGKQHRWGEVNDNIGLIQCEKCGLATLYLGWYTVKVDCHFFDPYDPYDFS